MKELKWPKRRECCEKGRFKNVEDCPIIRNRPRMFSLFRMNEECVSEKLLEKRNVIRFYTEDKNLNQSFNTEIRFESVKYDCNVHGAEEIKMHGKVKYVLLVEEILSEC